MSNDWEILTPRILCVDVDAGFCLAVSRLLAGQAGVRASVDWAPDGAAALNALTRTLAADEPQISVNSICPGWVRTDMGGARAPRSVEEGADTAVWLATMADDVPSGGFFRNREPIPW